MGMYIRYTGQFMSRAGVRWQVDILQEAEEEFPVIGELTFEAEDALVIEWPETAKSDVICGSTATLRLESPGDRTYEDLYTIEPGRVRMDVWRYAQALGDYGTPLYWSGTLDPEFYEEPYERGSKYPVELVFSDFGILERKRYALAGQVTLATLVWHCVQAMGVSGGNVYRYISTQFTDGTAIDLSALSVRSDNFYDEDGEALTLRDVLEGVLQPLGLRITQRRGGIHVYDLNHLAGTDPHEVYWSGDSSTMGTDSVFSDVKITFSPYAEATLMDEAAVTYSGKYGTDRANWYAENPNDSEYGEFYTYVPEYYETPRTTNIDGLEAVFSIFLGNGKGLAYVAPTAKYFHIEAISGGDDVDGVAFAVKTGDARAHSTGASGQSARNERDALQSAGSLNDAQGEVFRTERVYLPPLPAEEAAKFRVRVKLPVLLDARYCPYNNDASEDGIEASTGYSVDNCWDNDKWVKAHTSWAFVPFRATIYDANGDAALHYYNKSVATTATAGIPMQETGSWEAGEDLFGHAWLAYYDTDGIKDGCGIRGWHTNHHNIGRAGDGSARKYRVYETFYKMEDGEYMPYPPQGGYLEIAVYQGAKLFEWGDSGEFFEGQSASSTWRVNLKYPTLRWVLYQAPTVEVVRKSLDAAAADLDDIEYTGWLNRSAKESLELDTICGSIDEPGPTARGLYTRVSTGEQVRQLQRAGVTDHPERLLIGTLYSQYADRKTKLTGEVRLDAAELCCYSEPNQPGKKFIMLGEVQNCIADTSEATLVELSADNYEAIEEVET